MPGIVDRRKLLEISMRVGVGPSLSFLRKQGGLRGLLRLSGASADSLYDALAPHVGDPALNLAGFHYFTFNRLLETWTWERERAAPGDPGRREIRSFPATSSRKERTRWPTRAWKRS